MSNPGGPNRRTSLIQKIFRDLIFYKIVVTAWWLRRLPYLWALALGRLWGLLVFDLFRIRRAVTLNNLRRALGREKPKAEILSIARRTYQNLGQAFVEFCLIPRLVRKRRLSGLVTSETFQFVQQAASGGKGCLLMSGHFGNWELSGGFICQSGLPVDFVVKEIRNPKLDRWVSRYRQLLGVGRIPMDKAPREVITATRTGRCVAMLADQYAGAEGVIVDFFGLPTSTPKGPAALALKLDIPIVCGFLIREGGGRFRLIVEPPIRPSPTGDRERDIQRLTQEFTRILEKYVRLYPDHWLWTHRRWKDLDRKEN